MTEHETPSTYHPFRSHPVRSKDGSPVRQHMLDLDYRPTLHGNLNQDLTKPGRKPEPDAEPSPW